MLPALASTVIAAVAWAPALACAGLTPGPAGVVTEIVDGDTVVLDGGIQVRLIGMQAPKLPLGRDGFVAWPLAEEARDFVTDLVGGRRVELRYAGERQDRYGRALGQLFVADSGEWVQGAVLEAGLARVYSFADNRFCLDELYAAEQAARLERRGVWSLEYYAPRNAHQPDALLALEGRYELVEGRVLNADRAGDRVYLNFGRVWKEDFTVIIDPPAQRLFEKAGLDPLALESEFVRVRGWVENFDGPRIEVTHPEQIEILAAL
jgi:endonuclease YncB( thermonuclease family)